MDDQAVSMWS